MATLYQHIYHPELGYVVYRCGEDDHPADRRVWALTHKQAIFVTEMAAIDYCHYRNQGVDIHGDDRLPVHMHFASESNPFVEGTDLYLAYEAGFDAAFEQRRKEDEEDETYPARAANALQNLKDEGSH